MGRGGEKDTFPFYLPPYRSKSRLEKKNDEAGGGDEGLGETKGLTRCFET